MIGWGDFREIGDNRVGQRVSGYALPLGDASVKDEVIRVVEWTRTPGSRHRDQGPWSAEQFREEVLRDALDRAIEAGGTLTIDMDGTAGYLPSFLEELFGGLSRRHGTAVVERHLRIIHTDDPVTLEDAWDYVRNPRPQKRPDR